jgi:flavin reductase
VTIVTFASDGGPRGITVNAFTSVSLDPPLILISIAERARSHDLLRDRPFAVNVLRTEQEFLARHFAGMPDQGLSVSWVEGKVAPKLEGTLAWLECEPWRAYEAGDHTLYLGEVVAFAHQAGDALGYFAGAFFPIPQPVPSTPPFPYDPFELPYDAID